jgi:hypothetical protein
MELEELGQLGDCTFDGDVSVYPKDLSPKNSVTPQLHIIKYSYKRINLFYFVKVLQHLLASKKVHLLKKMAVDIPEKMLAAQLVEVSGLFLPMLLLYIYILTRFTKFSSKSRIKSTRSQLPVKI